VTEEQMQYQAEPGTLVAISRGPGGLPGVDAHVGVWRAMEERGIRPTHLYGCSAGALVSALQAAGHAQADMERMLRGLRTRDVVKRRPLWWLRARWLTHLLDPAPIKRLLAVLLAEPPASRPLPLTVSATLMGHDKAVPLRIYDCPWLHEAVLASMSIAGVWPYVRMHDGLRYSDGGTTDAIVLPGATARPAFRQIWIVELVRRRSYRDRDRNMLSRLLWSVEQLTEVEGALTRQLLAGCQAARWLTIDLGDSSCLSFDHGLIDRSYAQAAAQLERCPAPLTSTAPGAS